MGLASIPKASGQSDLHMNQETKGPRVIALGLFVNGDTVLLSEGYDSTRRESFFRPFGGGVEFGERAEVALRREIEEELGSAIAETTLLAVFENIFTFEARLGHEIVFMFRARLLKQALYAAERIQGHEGITALAGRWVGINDIINGTVKVYPEAIPVSVWKSL